MTPARLNGVLVVADVVVDVDKDLVDLDADVVVDVDKDQVDLNADVVVDASYDCASSPWLCQLTLNLY